MTIRIYQPTSLTSGITLQLDEKGSHHLARVLRANIGDELLIFNGNGGEYLATITQISKKAVTVTVGQHHDREAESPIDLYLAQGIARGEKMDFIIQKAVELGVSKIFPLVTERCNVRLKDEREAKRIQHWQSVAISACEQSGRNQVPVVEAPALFQEFLQNKQADHAFVLSPHVSAKLVDSNVQPGQSILLLIGPEGGLSDLEVQMALTKQFIALNLGPRVLRTETATIAALALFQSRFGDIGNPS